jgi:uncharacterized radical SAM superfamily protein
MSRARKSGAGRANTRATRGVLVTYAPVYAPNALMPDNGLAQLAATANAAGHTVRILDYNTTNSMRRLVPPFWSRRLSGIWETLSPRMAQDNPTKADKIVMGLAAVVMVAIDKIVLGYTRRAEVHRVAREIIHQARTEGVDWVGFKLWNGDGYSMPLAIAREVKRACPHLKLFAGGPHADYFYRTIIEETDVFDAIAYGSGEEALVGLADWVGGHGERALQAGDIPNIIFRNGEGSVVKNNYRQVDLSILPPPDYSETVYPAMAGNQKLKVMVQVDLLGCYWQKCAFCAYKLRSPKVQEKRAEQIFAEMQALAEKGWRAFRFAGASLDPALHNRLADLILASDLKGKIKFAAFVRAQKMDELDLAKLVEAGLDSVMIGVESGSPTLLSSLNKGETVEVLERQIKRFKEAGVFVVASLVGFPPGQTDETFQETLDFLGSARPDAIVYTPPLAIPGTPWWDNAERFGIEIDKPEEDAIRALMRYPIKYLVPPQLWPRMPFKFNGLDSKGFLAKVGDEAKEIAQLGIPSRISDDTALFAHLLAVSPAQFRDDATGMFFAADADRIDGLVARLNRAISGLGN